MTGEAGCRAIFLDRDGTLNVERGFVTRPEAIAILPGVPGALRRLASAGFKLVIVTNQSGIAQGLYGEADLAAVHADLHRRLGGLPDAYFHCPHHPARGVNGYGTACDCRKPAPGLLHRAARILGLTFAGSFLIGDSARDLLPAKDLPLGTILLRTGKPWRPELERLVAAGCEPDAVCDDLAAAAERILEGLDR